MAFPSGQLQPGPNMGNVGTMQCPLLQHSAMCLQVLAPLTQVRPCSSECLVITSNRGGVRGEKSRAGGGSQQVGDSTMVVQLFWCGLSVQCTCTGEWTTSLP